MHRWALLLLLSCKSPDVSAPDAGAIAPEPKPVTKTSADPNDPFAPYPGSQELCNRVVIAEGKPLHWRSWVTADDWVKVGDYYKGRTPGMITNPSTDRLEIHSGAGLQDRVLMVYPAAVASSKPQCDKPLASGDKTVIMVSEQRMPQP